MQTSYYAFIKGTTNDPDTDGFQPDLDSGETIIVKAGHFVKFFTISKSPVYSYYDPTVLTKITYNEAKKIAVDLLIKMIVDKGAMLEAELRGIYQAIKQSRELIL